MSSTRIRSHVVLAGGTGFLGDVLARALTARGVPVVVLTRRPRPARGLVRFIPWDGRTVGDWRSELEGAAAVINLAGRSVDCRYGPANRRRILESRVDSTRALGEAIAACALPPATWINSSSATIYRHALDRPMDEPTGELGSGFSVDVCRAWEKALFEAAVPRTRRVALRTALVMGRDGGPFPVLARLARFGLGGTFASGEQYVSWIHEEDFAAAVLHVLDTPGLEGPVNVAAPDPRPNAEFMRTLRHALGVRIGLPSARWMLEVGAFLLRTETELVLKSRRVVPTRLLASGFRFRYTTIEEALPDLARLDDRERCAALSPP